MKNKILNVEITTEEQRNELVKQLQEMEFKKELPKSWEELEGLKGYWIDEDSVTRISDMESYSEKDLNVFKTEKQAKKALAMAQLSQLMAVYNDDWEPDWDSTQDKYTINREGNNIIKTSWCFTYSFLAFKDELTRDAFCANFEPLIRQFFELDGN
jgi:hypothetical protein